MNNPSFDYCPHQDTCKVCQYFEKYAVKVIINSYCHGDYATCKRYQLKAAGEPVADNVLPTGPQVWATD